MDDTMRRHASCLSPSSSPVVPRSVPAPEQAETPTQATERRAQAARPTYNLAGYPPAVREGYIDGCESAKRPPTRTRTPKRMASDPQYSMGWNDGFSICSKK